MYYNSLIGRKYNNWEVLDVGRHGKGISTRMKCRCSCGTEREVDAYSLVNGYTRSCGHCQKIVRENDYMRCICKNDTSFIFDEIDMDFVKSHTWSLAKGYIRTTVDGKTAYLHKMLFGNVYGYQIDHIDGNKLNNRRNNLRIATHAENQRNKGLRSDSSTGYKGVCLDKRTNKYISYINTNKKRTYLGSYELKSDAAIAYDNAALIQHEKFAKLNFEKKEAGFG